jgi:hypothetical protein
VRRFEHLTRPSTGGSMTYGYKALTAQQSKMAFSFFVEI